MIVAHSIDQTRAAVLHARSQGQVGLVPTMGALHEGHLSLIRLARAECNFVAVTIFVNPKQFGPSEDLTRYPRPLEQDLELCRNLQVDLVFVPSSQEMYPAGFASHVLVDGLSERVEGASRPGHFQGVATVVLKLFNIAPAHTAYFGQKDAQQLRVIEQMVQDLNLPIRIRRCPIVRDPDGLALSSRNKYLNATQRQQALALARSLAAAADLVAQGCRDANLVRQKMRSVLESTSGLEVDYAELVAPETFLPVTQLTGSVLAVVAARVGEARLIDNREIHL